MPTIYSAVLTGRNTIKIFDVQKGISTYSLFLGNVEVLNGPVVTNNKMTLVVKTHQGRTSGRVYTLPKGILSYSFEVK
jgi:hypothetical protein